MDKYTVYFNNIPVLKLNKNLVKRQDCKENLELIKKLHQERIELETFMFLMEDKEELKEADKLYTDIEFRLQDAWKFPRDVKFHRFWDRPKCKCPKMDNEDSYPTGYSVINGKCKLHGEII